MSFLGGLKEVWDSSGGKAVSGVADAGEAVGRTVGGVAKTTADVVTEGAGKVGEAGLNVVTAGGYARDKEQSATQAKIIEQLNRDREHGPAAGGDGGGVGRDAMGPPPPLRGDHEAITAEADKDPSVTAKYVVEQGDTLSAISQEKNVDMDKLTELNPELAADPNSLRPGQELSLGDDLVAAKDEVAGAVKDPATPVAAGPELSV